MQKFLLISMCKLENDYLDEWINHHLNIGFDKIVIIDNNDTKGEHCESIYSVPSVNDNRVEIYPLNDGKYLQQIYYTKIYEKYKYEYDWFMCLDIDEFLTLPNHTNVKDFVCQKKFKDYNAIRLSWLIYNDNNIIKTDDNFSVSRFTSPNFEHPENKLVKTLFKSFGSEDLFFPNSHGPMAVNIKCCNGDGLPVKFPQHPHIPSNLITHKDAYISHYITKTISEFLTKKLIRGGSAQSQVDLNDKYKINIFFRYNNITFEKIKYIKDFFKQSNVYEEVCKELLELKIKMNHKILFIGQQFMINSIKNVSNFLFLNSHKNLIDVDFISLSKNSLENINDINNVKSSHYKYNLFNGLISKNINHVSLNNLQKNKYDLIVYLDNDNFKVFKNLKHGKIDIEELLTNSTTVYIDNIDHCNYDFLYSCYLYNKILEPIVNIPISECLNCKKIISHINYNLKKDGKCIITKQILDEIKNIFNNDKY